MTRDDDRCLAESGTRRRDLIRPVRWALYTGPSHVLPRRPNHGGPAAAAALKASTRLRYDAAVWLNAPRMYASAAPRRDHSHFKVSVYHGGSYVEQGQGGPHYRRSPLVTCAPPMLLAKRRR